jgi:streptogramin lyase
LIGFLALAAAGILPAQPRAKDSGKPPKLGIQTPGVQIPFAKLKAEADLKFEGSLGPVLVEQSTWIANRSKNSVERVDPKKNETLDPLSGLNEPCMNPQLGFGSVWVLNCGDGTLARIDAKTATVSKTFKTGAGTARAGMAVSADSVWVFTDDKTTFSRIDPAENKVVGETRLPAGCNSTVFGETSLWVSCSAENRVLRVDPILNTVTQRIEVSAEPFAIAVGEGSVWVFCRKEGKVERIDPKTNKVAKTIELAVPNVDGDIAVGDGSVWISMPGFPITRIDPKTDKVPQQFVGEGGGFIRVAQGAVWLTNLKQATVSKFDTRRVLATLAE